MIPRTVTVAVAVVRSSEPILDDDDRDHAVGATLDAIALEGIGVASLEEWAGRLTGYAVTLAAAGRDHEARMVVAAAEVLDG